MTLPATRSRAPGSKSAGGPCLVTTLPDRPSALLLARRAVDSFGLSTTLGEDARLIVTELVTNALRHGRGTASLSLSRAANGSLNGAVSDDGDGFAAPAPRPAGTHVGGLGLAIVEALSEDWGIASGSTRVWFQMYAESSRLS